MIRTMQGIGGAGRSTLASIQQEVPVTFRYPVCFTRGLLDTGNPLLRDAIAGDATPGARRALFVVDAGAARHHPELVEGIGAYCRAHADALELVAPPILMPGGETVKNDPVHVERVQAAIEAGGICRQSYLVAVGGGAVLDAAGFAAATAHRGVRLVRVPTTVLAQNDSAVGIKNGINAFGKKNFVGVFAPPHAVLNDYDFLVTLADRDWRGGLSEAVKVALLKDPAFFDWLEEHADDLRSRDMAAMEHAVHRCAELHLDHIATSGDPFELGSSRPLDFGHWAAHKLEALSGYALRHGEAVAVGLALDSTYAHLAGLLGEAEWRRVLAVLAALGLSLHTPELALERPDGRPRFLEGLDEFREHLGGRLTVMLLEGIGRGLEVHALSEPTLLRAAALLREHDAAMTKEDPCQPTPALAR
ncbi:MAG: 3-dehydroquinate synthase [Actinomycetota bacterium]|nr:3-dehydroquinate synthase [Actinomycetota bacterium]